MRPLLIALGFVFIMYGCKKAKTNSTPSYMSVIECHNATGPDSLTMLNRVKGHWKLENQECGWVGAVDISNKNVTAILSGNGSFTVIENSNTIYSGTWSLKRNNSFMGGNTVWQLQLSDPAHYLSGALYICEKYLVIDGGLAVDGCVFTYRKTGN